MYSSPLYFASWWTNMFNMLVSLSKWDSLKLDGLLCEEASMQRKSQICWSKSLNWLEKRKKVLPRSSLIWELILLYFLWFCGLNYWHVDTLSCWTYRFTLQGEECTYLVISPFSYFKRVLQTKEERCLDSIKLKFPGLTDLTNEQSSLPVASFKAVTVVHRLLEVHGDPQLPLFATNQLRPLVALASPFLPAFTAGKFLCYHLTSSGYHFMTDVSIKRSFSMDLVNYITCLDILLVAIWCLWNSIIMRG